MLLCLADRSLELNLAAGLHVRLLRQDLARWPEAVLREAPTGEDAYGWLSGPQGAHTAEVVFPLLTRRRATTPDRSRPALAPARPVRAQPPGGEWLYAKVYTSTRRQNELLTAQLPRLLAELPAEVDRWFFLRYRDPEPHLRLRFHGDPTALNRRLLPACHDWFADLHRAGLAGRLVLDTYEPEWERYGGRAAMTAAEEAFCADSAAVIAQLSATETGRLALDSVLLAALNMLDIAGRLHGERAEEWLLDTYPRSAVHDGLRDSRTAATRLSEPSSLRTLPGGAELLASWQQREPVLSSATASCCTGRPAPAWRPPTWCTCTTTGCSASTRTPRSGPAPSPAARPRPLGAAACTTPVCGRLRDRTHRGVRGSEESGGRPRAVPSVAAVGRALRFREPRTPLRARGTGAGGIPAATGGAARRAR